MSNIYIYNGKQRPYSYQILIKSYQLINIINLTYSKYIYIEKLQTIMNGKDEKVNQYFKQFQKLVEKNKQSQRIIQIDTMIQQYISNGQIVVNKKKPKELPHNCIQMERQIKSKKDHFDKQFIDLSISLSRSGFKNRRASNKSRRISSTRTLTKESNNIQNQQMIDNHNKQMSGLERIKELKKQKNILKKVKELQQLERLTRQEAQQKQEMQRKQKQENKKIGEKLLAIYERMRKLQNQREKRIRTLQQSHIKSSPILTKYKQIQHQVNAIDQKQYYEKLHKFKQQKFKQRLESSQQAAKQHAKEYDKYLKQRQSSVKMFKQSRTAEQIKEIQDNYNKNKISQQKLQKSLQKCWKVKQYQQKIDDSRRIMKLDPKVGIQIEAAKDKAKHPFKYHYLKQKNHITDIQIYENHRNFNFKQSHIEKGNQYLNQLKIRKSISQQALKRKSFRIKTDGHNNLQIFIKPVRDYLEESKKMAVRKKVDQMDKLMKQYGEKSKVFQILQNRANIHMQNSINKIADLQKANTYCKTLNIQQEVDQQFICAIKAKIKCLQIN